MSKSISKDGEVVYITEVKEPPQVVGRVNANGFWRDARGSETPHRWCVRFKDSWASIRLPCGTIRYRYLSLEEAEAVAAVCRITGRTPLQLETDND